MRSPLPLSLLSAFLFFLALQGQLRGFTVWIAFIPLFFLLDQIQKVRSAVFWSWMTGFLTYLLSALWLTHVTVLGYLLLCLILSFYFAIFGGVYKSFRVCKNFYGILFLSSLWVFLEYLRSLGPMGFPWFFLGYSQYHHLAFIQIASVGGGYCLSFLIVWVNRAIYELVFYSVKNHAFGAGGGLPRKCLLALVSCVFMACVYGYGYDRLEKSTKKDDAPHIKIALIQGNIPQEEKWNPAQAKFILKKYEALTLEALKEKPDLLVWPETSLPSDLRKDKYLNHRIKKLAYQAGCYLLLGGNDDRIDEEGIVTNAAFLISPQGEIVDQYDKIHLVPYGEYVPGRKWTPWVGKITIGEIDFSPGHIFKVFQMSSFAFSSVICFEDVLVQHVRKFAKAGAQFIVNVTNDAWFGKSQAAEQHLHLSRFSAIANGISLVRATNTGVSAFVSPYGKILQTIHDDRGERVEVEGIAVREIEVKSLETFYRKWGDIFSWMCGGIVLIFLTSSMIKKLAMQFER
jgi:apolipoprotein N-acyltransferase